MTRNWQCLRALLVTPGVGQGDQGVVEIERFGKILSLFGPMTEVDGFFQLVSYIFYHNSRFLFVDNTFKIESILKQKWFHGDMGAQECEAKLSNKKPGNYLTINTSLLLLTLVE